MKLLKLELDEGPIVKNICEDMADAGQPFADIFTAFLETYDFTVDSILVTRHGKKEVFADMLEEYGNTPLFSIAIQAYLTERAQWIRQQLAYNNADYDPIENFVAHEEETTEFDIKQRHNLRTDTQKAYTFTHTKQTPQIITENYTEADAVTETTQLKSTTENSVAPFDSDTYHKETKSETTPGKITNTEKPYNRKFKTPQVTVTDTDTQAADRQFTVDFTDDAHKDKHTRELDRHGNQGIQTASQMMSLDESWWRQNRWLSQMALDIVNLICERTEAI